jgi:hypothetical protein
MVKNMKVSAAVLLLAVVSVSPDSRYFQFERLIQSGSQQSGQSCLVLEPAIFAHAAPRLADLRLYNKGNETPYVVRVSASTLAEQKPVAPLNLGLRGGQIAFDAAMPDGSYSDVQLTIAARDFIATVVVSGSQNEEAGAETKLGSFTIFDLTRQKLGRSTILHLPVSDFRYLHFRIGGPLKPENVSGLSVGSAPASLPAYSVVAQTSTIARKGRASVLEFVVPAHVPVDRVVFAPSATPAQFSRDVTISVSPVAAPASIDAPQPPPPVNSYGNILRVHSIQNGRQIDEERLAIDAPSADFSTPAKWTISIENGDDAPLNVQSVQLQMLQRSLCFDAEANGSYLLAYGDAALSQPSYDYAAIFAPQANAAQVSAGPEQPNPAYQPRPDDRPFTERHPALLWVALAAVIALLGAIALRSAKRVPPAP